jgi:hypothetical protein
LGDSAIKRYWYLIISIENRTGTEVELVPQAAMATDAFQVLPAGTGAPAGLFDLIKARHKHAYPYLQPWPLAPERIMPGPDHARDYVLIWPEPETAGGKVSVFLGGLSNEMAVIDHPTSRQADGMPVKVFLRKTLELDFVIGPTISGPAGPVDSRWVMR